MSDNSYPAVMARKNAIMRSALGLDYDEFITSPIAFDYEAMMAATGYCLDPARHQGRAYPSPRAAPAHRGGPRHRRPR